MSLSVLNSRLAAIYGTRQYDLLAQADRMGDTVDTAVLRWWKWLWQFKGVPPHSYFRQLTDIIHTDVRNGLTKLAYWGHGHTAKTLTKTLPLPWLQAMAFRRGRRFPEARHKACGIATNGVAFLEDESFATSQPGGIELILQQFGLTARDMFAPFRQPSTFTPTQLRELYQALLFPPPSATQVGNFIDRIIAGSPIVSRHGSTMNLQSMFVQGYAQGKGIKEIAADLEPLVNNVQSSARRISRTWGVHVAHAMQDESHKAVDDLIIGQQIRNPGDVNTRPAHRLRMGTIYYKEPKPGQLGYDKMPRPPLEADKSVAWSCRCWLSVILSPPSYIANDQSKMALFKNAEGDSVPDVAVYQDWFSRAPERERRFAVGSRRYSEVADIIGATPDYAHFVGTDGALLSVNYLRDEDKKDRDERLNLIRSMMTQRRADISTLATYGFLPTS